MTLTATRPTEPRAPATRGLVRVTGTRTRPVLWVYVPQPDTYHPTLKITMRTWLRRDLRAKPHDTYPNTWIVTGLNSRDPRAVLAAARLDIEWPPPVDQDVSHAASFDDLVAPVAKLDSDGRTVLVRHRLAGYEPTRAILGDGAEWDGKTGLFRQWIGDIIHLGKPRPGIVWPQAALDQAYALHAHQPVPRDLHTLAADLAHAIDITAFDPAQLRAAVTRTGAAWPLPKATFTPFPYQWAGAVAGFLGRTCLFDEPGVGKTLTALTIARMHAASRTIIVCPPLLTTNWQTETIKSGLHDAPTIIEPGRPAPDTLPAGGVIIVPDSTLAARPELVEQLRWWAADVMLVDEAHRLKSYTSNRTRAVLSLGTSIRTAPVAISGTPIFQSPHEAAPLLELTRMLAPIFGGRHAFLHRYCVQDRRGEWSPRDTALDLFRRDLATHVWIRRRKAQVLPQLPEKLRTAIEVQVPLREYRDTHRDVIARIRTWARGYQNEHGRMPDQAARDDYARQHGLALASQLRRAAGLAKIKPAVSLITDHLTNNPPQDSPDGRRWPRPLIVWTHHVDVAEAALTAIRDTGVPHAAIIGTTTNRDRDAAREDFQAGRLAVLVCAITKAGVGLTLTAASDALFIEHSFTPAELVQAEDRMHRQGQQAHGLIYTSLIARGTLDDLIQKVLHEKTHILETALGDEGNRVAVTDETTLDALPEIVATLMDAALTSTPGDG